MGFLAALERDCDLSLPAGLLSALHHIMLSHGILLTIYLRLHICLHS